MLYYTRMSEENSIDAIAEDIDVKKARKQLSENNPLKLLKPRQRKFLKYFLKTKDRATAWMMSHPTTKDRVNAHVNCSIFLRNHPEVVEWLYSMAGMGEDDLITVVRNSMSAEKKTFYLGKEYVEPDHYARLKAADLALKMRESKEPQKIGNQVNIQIITDKDKGIFKIIEGDAK